jgi:hypothetical protein
VERDPCQKIAPRKAPEVPQKTGVERTSLDYSRFDGIGDEVQETTSLPEQDIILPTSNSAPTPASASSVPPKRSLELNYARFEEVSEEDATVPLAELEKKWHQEAQLQRMRGETPEGFAEWQRRRAKLGNLSLEEAPTGRGLWSRTNMEETFATEARRAADEQPTDAELPALSPPDLLSAMTSAPGAQVMDMTKWARGILREELVKACATDKSAGVANADVRVDAIAYNVDVGDGNTAIVLDGQQFLCAYRFSVSVAYCVAISERPVDSEVAPEAKYMGDITISELASGIAAPGTGYLEALTKRMKTSLRDPKPSKRHLSAMRPVLGRLELSLAYFVRRFERRLLAYPSTAMKRAS